MTQPIVHYVLRNLRYVTLSSGRFAVEWPSPHKHPYTFPPSLSRRRRIRFISHSSSSGHLTKFSTWRSWWRRRRWPIARDWWWRAVHGGQTARRSWGRTRPSCIHNGLRNRNESYVHRTEQSTNISKKWQTKEAVLISCQLPHHQVPRGQHQRQNLYPYFGFHLCSGGGERMLWGQTSVPTCGQM